MRARHVLVVALIAVVARAESAYAQSASDALPTSQKAVACAPPSALTAPPSGGLRILGTLDTRSRALFGTRDLVLVSGGAQAGVQLGQEYFIRRAFAFGRYASGQLHSVHTTGWLRIVAVNDTVAIAMIDSICDGVIAGDYLEPFVAPPFTGSGQADASGDLDFSSPGRVMFGNEERRIGAPGDFMFIDRGSAQGVAPGARFAVYRDLQTPGVVLAAIGEGVIVSTASTTSVMRITTARDAVESGDYVVPRK